MELWSSVVFYLLVRFVQFQRTDTAQYVINACLCNKHRRLYSAGDDRVASFHCCAADFQPAAATSQTQRYSSPSTLSCLTLRSKSYRTLACSILLSQGLSINQSINKLVMLMVLQLTCWIGYNKHTVSVTVSYIIWVIVNTVNEWLTSISVK